MISRAASALCVAYVLWFSLAFRAAATPVVLHEGGLDPTSESWELAIAGDSGASGGTETTTSGEHAFWEVRDSATDGGIAYGFALTPENLSADWRLEAILRVVEAPTCPGCVDFGDVGVIVRDGLNYWSFYLGESNAGPVSDSGKTGQHSLALSHALDTRSDYHRYEIRFSHNGPGAADDTADFLVDGLLVFDDVGRSGLWTASDVRVGFGAVSTAGVGTARWERVLFDDGRVPEPGAVLLLGAAAAAFLAQRRARR